MCMVTDRAVLWARRHGIAADVVTLQGGVEAVRICAEAGGPEYGPVMQYAARRGLVTERRGRDVLYLYAPETWERVRLQAARQSAAADLFFAARRPELYGDALPGLRERCRALGMDADACEAAGVDAVPAAA